MLSILFTALLFLGGILGGKMFLKKKVKITRSKVNQS